MYRTLLPVFLCVGAATAAPQNDNSQITYVRLKPLTDDTSNPRLPARESRIENIPLTIPGIDNEQDSAKNKTIDKDSNRHSRSDTTSFYENETDTTEVTTERESVTVDELQQGTEVYEARTKGPSSPKFLSKLSYFQKQNEAGSVVTNLIERTAKRRFRSKCRCEKIWNCHKLQISVPRCPNEYFMCCF